MNAETIHFVLELFVGLITLGLGGMFTFILRIESRTSRIETKLEYLDKLFVKHINGSMSEAND